MVLQCVIFRVGDGLPLSASTDNDSKPELRECQKCYKRIARRLSSLPDRCSLYLEGHHIHLISALGLGFFVLCEASYPAVLAFCFLDEVQKEFILTYTTERVKAARRPYAFIEFDMYLQRAKQRFNSPRSLTTRLNLPDMSTELKLRPAHIITEEELRLTDNGAILRPHKDSNRPVVSPSRRLQPLTWVGMLSVLLSSFCALLNLTRGLTVISHGHVDAEDHYAYRHGSVFLLTTFCYVHQVYLLFHMVRWRRTQSLVGLLAIAVCSYELQNFRNSFQILFHIVSALFACCMVFARRQSEKLPGYSV